jgi:single-stranded-DNA-specific exonuclease
LAIKLDRLDEFKEFLKDYCKENISDLNLQKSLKIDTKIYSNERNIESLSDIEKLAPFGEGNREPVFIIDNLKIKKVEKV